MDEWKVGDPADWGDSVGVPDIPYMGYLNGYDDEEENNHYGSNSNNANSTHEVPFKTYRSTPRKERKVEKKEPKPKEPFFIYCKNCGNRITYSEFKKSKYFKCYKCGSILSIVGYCKTYREYERISKERKERLEREAREKELNEKNPDYLKEEIQNQKKVFKIGWLSLRFGFFQKTSDEAFKEILRLEELLDSLEKQEYTKKDIKALKKENKLLEYCIEKFDDGQAANARRLLERNLKVIEDASKIKTVKIKID